MRALLLAALLPLTAQAFDLTYYGEYAQGDDQSPAPITHNAIPVSSYLSIVQGVFPVTDGVDANGNRHCWFMIDTELELKAMIAAQPIEGDRSGIAGDLAGSDMRDEILAFAEIVYREAELEGGIDALSAQCAGTEWM